MRPVISAEQERAVPIEPKRSNAHRWAALVFPGIHLLTCAAAQLGLFGSEGSWGWFPVFVVDFPFSILLLPALKVAPPLLVFGIVGTAWWYLINWAIVYCVRRLSGKARGR